MNRSLKLRVQTLEDRLVPATVVLQESTFDPQAFGSQIHAALDYNIVGYAYAVNHNGAAVVSTGTGGLYGPDDGRARTSADDNETVFQTDTRIEIASVSKIITTVAVLRLLESQGGDLNALLSTPISTYLPSDWTIGPNVNLITIRHLLTHTSGFVEGGPKDPANAIGVNFENFGNNNLQNLRALVAAGLGAPTRSLPDGSPAYPRSYSNANFSLLAKMIPYMLPDGWRDILDNVSLNDPDSADAVFGGLYSAYVAENVLAPCGIDNPTMDVTGDNLALSYVFDTAESVAGSSAADQTDVGGAFGWKLTAPELARFMNTVRHTNTVLSDTARDLMNNNDFLLGWSPDSSSSTDPYVFAPLQDAFGSYYQHNGAGNGGFRSQIVMFPGDVEASLVMNSYPPGITNRFALMREAYQNAWSGLVIEGDDSKNVFVVRLNAEDASKIDIIEIVDDQEIVIASPAVDLLTSLQFRGLGGNDQFLIEDLPKDTDLVLNGGAGDDSFTIGTGAKAAFDHIHGNLTIVGGDGEDSVSINDAGGIGDDYAIRGVHNNEILADGTVWATDYTAEKLFTYDEVERLVLLANSDANQITVDGITERMTVEVHAGGNDDTILVSNLTTGAAVNVFGEGGADSFVVRNTAPLSFVIVSGDPLGLPGSDDTLTLGNGDLGTVQGSVQFEGGDGFDRLVLDDTAAATGRYFEFTDGAVNGDFGDLIYFEDVESVRLDAGSRDDDIFVESLNRATDLDLYGHDGSDTFAVSGRSHNVDPVLGHVVVHGGSGYAQTHIPGPGTPEDSDWLYVFDDLNTAAGNFIINQDGDYLHGRLNKLGLSPDVAALDVAYDQIEHTELRTGAGDDTIGVIGAPRFNQLSVYAGAGKDRIDVESTPLFAGPMIIGGEAGDDVVRVSPTAQDLGNLRSPLSIEGGEGQDAVAVFDTLSGYGAPYGLDSSSLTRGVSAGVAYQTIEELEISLSNASNTIAVGATAPGTTVTIYGNAGDDALTAAGLASALSFVGGTGNDAAVLTGTNGDDVMTAIGETVTLGAGSLTSSAESRTVNGMGGNDQLILNGTAGINDSFVLRPSSTAYAGKVSLNPFTPIACEQVEMFTVQGNPGEQDTLQINGQTEPNLIGGGAFTDWFTINLAAAGTTADPFCTLRDSSGHTMLTLTDYEGVADPKVMGLLGADIFDVYAAATAFRSRGAQIDGGGEGGSLKGDQLFVHYVARGAIWKKLSSSPKDGKISIDYPHRSFGIAYQDMEAVQMLPT